MDAAKKQKLIDQHRINLTMFGVSPHTLQWASRGVQKARFKALAEIGMASGDSLLDVGCGFADLKSWLVGNDLSLDYTGLDLSPEITSRAGDLHPDCKLLCGELFDFEFAPQTFDWVVLSGTLNWQLHDDGVYARKVIERMFELCRFGVAFNMLDCRNREMQQLEELVAFDPEKMLAFCAGIAADSQCRTDYLDNDFTIYMRRLV